LLLHRGWPYVADRKSGRHLQAAQAFDELVDPETQSAPKDIGAFLALVVEIMFDPYNAGYRGEKTTWLDESGTLHHGEAGTFTYGRRLPHLLPYLHGQDRKVSGPGFEKWGGAPEPATYSFGSE